MAISEILHEHLPEFAQRLSVRKVKQARTRHLCGISGHTIEAGEPYTRISYLTGYRSLVMVCNCANTVCVHEPEPDHVSDKLAQAFALLALGGIPKHD